MNESELLSEAIREAGEVKKILDQLYKAQDHENDLTGSVLITSVSRMAEAVRDGLSAIYIHKANLGERNN